MDLLRGYIPILLFFYSIIIIIIKEINKEIDIKVYRDKSDQHGRIGSRRGLLKAARIGRTEGVAHHVAAVLAAVPAGDGHGIS